MMIFLGTKYGYFLYLKSIKEHFSVKQSSDILKQFIFIVHVSIIVQIARKIHFSHKLCYITHIVTKHIGFLTSL